ncbi:MAG TPA: GTP cyclohydrolase IIa [Nitrosopumilaceae archaeon]|nr:GTP cyclohydrolase IIa [Nitrosopumilaceae archaeon]
MIQLTIIKITGYGPWTLTLGSDREHKLQMLQSSIYNEIQNLFSEKNCLVFSNRFDELFAVTNGLSLDAHIEIQKKLAKSFDLQLSMTIGYGDSPFEANLNADKARKSKIILEKEYNIFGYVDGKAEQLVQIMHMDVDGSTSISAKKSPYEISSLMFKLYSEMSEFFLTKNCLTFFMGGDNFMIVTSGDGKDHAVKFLNLMKEKHGIALNCGIGTANTAREAAKLATKSLDAIREFRDSGKNQQRVLELTC